MMAVFLGCFVCRPHGPVTLVVFKSGLDFWRYNPLISKRFCFRHGNSCVSQPALCALSFAAASKMDSQDVESMADLYRIFSDHHVCSVCFFLRISFLVWIWKPLKFFGRRLYNVSSRIGKQCSSVLSLAFSDWFVVVVDCRRSVFVLQTQIVSMEFYVASFFI